MAYDWNCNERHGRFDDVRRPLFFTVVTLLLWHPPVW